MRFLVVNGDTQLIEADWATEGQAKSACKALNAKIPDEQDKHFFVQPTCPRCDGDDVTHAHANESFAHPETDYWLCVECGHQWGHE